MKQLIIKLDRCTLTGEKNNYYELGQTNCALGNVIYVLETLFPIDNGETFKAKKYNSPEYETNAVINQLFHKEKIKEVYGFRENGGVMYMIYDFFNDRDKIKLSLKDIEEIRIINTININFLPLDRTNINNGMNFPNIKSIREIIYCILYYYAYYDYKLVKCEHCGRWFATNSFKNKYCPRNSTFEGYTHLNCEQAVRNIKQELQREKKRIYNKMTLYTQNYGNNKINSFLEKCAQYLDKIKECATVENLSAYWSFLKQYKDGETDASIQKQ